MPGSGTGHLRRVVRNDDAVKIIARQDCQNANHIYVTFIDKRLAVVRDFAHHVAQMNVGNLSLAAVAIDRFVDVALGHFGDGSNAKLQSIAGARGEHRSTVDTCWGW